MRFASICAPVFDALSPLVLREFGSENSTVGLSRRNTITATLDGGSALEDGGYTDSDRAVSLAIPRISLAQHTELERLLKTYSFVVLSFYEGAFTAAPQTYTISRGDATLSMRLVSRLSG